MTFAIEVKNLSLSYDISANKPDEKRAWIFKNLNFQIKAGEFILLTGFSGCGKSSLINMINGVIPGLKKAYTKGDIYIHGNNITDTAVRKRTRWIGSVFQNPREQIIFDEVSDEIIFPMENLGFTPRKMGDNLKKLLKMIGLAGNAKTATLSGGEKQKLMTACTLGMGQKILILDEPLANMDTQSSEELLQLLKRLTIEESYTVVITEHRQEMVLPYADKVFASNKSSAENVLMEIEIWEDVNAYSQSILFAAIDRPKRFATSNKNEREILFSVKGMDFQIGERVLFENFTWEIKRGEEWVVLGENGSGKTTLFKLLHDFSKPTAGRITSIYSKKEKRKKIGYVLQNPDYQLFMPKVKDELCLNAKNNDFVDELVKLFCLEDMLERHPLSLSEGQKRKLGFACIIAKEPEVLFLDEPTVGLDNDCVEQLLDALELLRKRSKKELTVISISHDKRVIPYLGNQQINL